MDQGRKNIGVAINGLKMEVKDGQQIWQSPFADH
jgi:hypothetical protein